MFLNILGLSDAKQERLAHGHIFKVLLFLQNKGRIPFTFQNEKAFLDVWI